MVIGVLFPGVLAGLGAFALALFGGMPLWAAILAYAGTGSLTVLLMGCLLALCRRSRRALACDMHGDVLISGGRP
jgi:hypothetical protein